MLRLQKLPNFSPPSDSLQLYPRLLLEPREKGRRGLPGFCLPFPYLASSLQENRTPERTKWRVRGQRFVWVGAAAPASRTASANLDLKGQSPECVARLAWASLGPSKSKEEAGREHGPSPLVLCQIQRSISVHTRKDAARVTVKLARPAGYCARGSATVGARSCERRRAKLAQEVKRRDARQLREGGRETARRSGAREGRVAELGGRSGS